MIAGIVIALFGWATLTGVSYIGSSFAISMLAAGMAAVTLGMAAVSYFLVPENYKTVTAYAAYLLLIGTVAVLILDTGASASPFIALWMITAVFAGIFGGNTLVLLLIGVNAYLGWQFYDNNLSKDVILSIILAGELPIFISYILWHSKSRSEKTKDRAYYDLANELNQVSNKAEVVINAIADGVIAIDNQGVIELINPAAQRIVGWGRQDAIGLDYKSVLQLLSKDNHELDKATDPIFEVLTTNQQKRNDALMLQTNSGKKLAVSVVASPIGHLGSGAIIVFRDITKEQAEEYAQAEFISTASHEMRTPVASIEGYLGLTLNPATATIDDKARDFIGKAHEAAQHLGRLFQDLLDVTKADDGRLSNNPKVIDVVSFTQDIIQGLQQKADAKQLRIFFKPSTSGGDESSGLHSINPMFYLHADADHLREVLSNLIENAIKYTLKGEIVVDVYGDNDHIVVSIADSGIGIPAEDIPHLFQKFYRVDNSDTREIGGTGLGLYLCRRLVEAMDGRIWVESEYKKGSTFSVELPRISHEEANRLIEAGASKPQISESTKSYIATTAGLSSTPQERVAALATPIIVEHGERVGAPVVAQTTAETPTARAATVVPAGEQPTPVATATSPAPVTLPPPPPAPAVPTPPVITPAAAPVVQQPATAPVQPAASQPNSRPLSIPKR